MPWSINTKVKTTFRVWCLYRYLVAGMKSVWGAGVMSMISRFWATYAMNTGFQFTVEVRKYKWQ
jgi:hypothetical protein